MFKQFPPKLISRLSQLDEQQKTQVEDLKKQYDGIRSSLVQGWACSLDADKVTIDFERKGVEIEEAKQAKEAVTFADNET